MCLLTIVRIAFSNSLPVVDKRLIGRKFWEIWNPFLVSARLYFLHSSKVSENERAEGSDYSDVLRIPKVSWEFA
jgi:hypothetical protein